MPTVKLTAQGSKYDQGKAYVAEIFGTDRKFTFNRDFCGARRFTSKSGSSWSLEFDARDGLYEVADTGKNGAVQRYYLVREGLSVKLKRETAIELAELLDKGYAAAELGRIDGEKLKIRDEDGKLIARYRRNAEVIAR